MAPGNHKTRSGTVSGALHDTFRSREDPGHPLTEEERLAFAVQPLLDWFARHARALPWRQQPEPYRVWVSEIMLQQTRVEAVKPYFARFMETWPTIRDLAAAGEEALMKQWEGLGYYSRARNLKKAAQAAVEQYGGALPADYEALKKLPGIGPYTAGAIASIAFQIPVPAVDGNVLRVIMRLLADPADIVRPAVKQQVEKRIRKVLPKDRPGDFNQALMELGAMVCVPNGMPRCIECPWEGLCLAKRQERTEEIPVRSPKKPRTIQEKTIFLIQAEGKTAVRKRPARGLLAGLYEFPSLDGRLTEEQVRALLEACPGNMTGWVLESLPEAKHIFTHREWHMTGWRLKAPETAAGRTEQKDFWDDRLKTGLKPVFGTLFPADRKTLETVYAIPSAFRKYSELV